jgi:hypothetical protein
VQIEGLFLGSVLEVGVAPGADLQTATDPAEGFIAGVSGDGGAAHLALGGGGRRGGGFANGFLGHSFSSIAR